MIIVEPTMVKLNQICESCFNSYRIGSVDVILQEDLYNPGTIAWKHIGNSSLKGLPCPTWGRPGFSLTLKLLVYYNCFVVWNMKNICFHIWGISSSQLTHIFQRGRSTTNQKTTKRSDFSGSEILATGISSWKSENFPWNFDGFLPSIMEFSTCFKYETDGI